MAAPVQRIDLLIAVTLALAVAFSAVGVATYDDDRNALFLIEWTTTSATLDAAPAVVSGAGDAELAFEVTERNLTSGNVTVTVAGGAARLQPVAIRAELTLPGGGDPVVAEATLPAGPAASVDLPLHVDLGLVPAPFETRSASPDAARDQVDLQYGSDLGVGTWTLRVSLAPGPVGAPESFTVSATAELQSYEATVTTETVEVPR